MTDDAYLSIVFSVNVGGLPGLGATVSSLLQNCSAPRQLHIYVMCSNLSEKHLDNIRTLFQAHDFQGKYDLISFNADTEFKGLPRLFGDLTYYGRLLIPEYIDVSRVLYLDSDLIVEIDVLPLRDFDMEGYSIAAVLGGQVAFTNDLSYFLDRGFSREMNYFNSGVLLMDLDNWKEKNITAAWREIVKDRPETIPTVDQTILNRVCGGDFRQLSKKYNVAYLAHYQKPAFDRAIFHFIGSPKPWDPLGRLIHGGYHLWRQYSPPFWEREYQATNMKRLRRGWKIRRSIGRAFHKRYLR